MLIAGTLGSPSREHSGAAGLPGKMLLTVPFVSVYKSFHVSRKTMGVARDQRQGRQPHSLSQSQASFSLT